MAAGDVSNLEVMSYGSRVLSTGKVEHGTSAGYTFDTGLSWVEQLDICWNTTTDGQDYIGYLNTNTTSDGVAGYGGKVYIAGDVGTWGSDGETYFFRAMGR